MNNEVADKNRLVLMTAEIVAAYIEYNQVIPAQLPELISNVHATLHALNASALEGAAEPVAKATAAQIKRSIRPEHLVSFEDGKPYKTLTRHLSKHSLTPDAYRQKWGLPPDYPMVSSDYSAHRSALAKSLGLGRGRAAQAGAGAAGISIADAGEERDIVDSITREPSEEDVSGGQT